MDLDNYFQHYADFDKRWCPSATIDEVEKKLLEEMEELRSCIQWPEKTTHEETLGELMDVLNVTLKLLKRYGINDPLYFGAEKLRSTSEKYKAQGK